MFKDTTPGSVLGAELRALYKGLSLYRKGNSTPVYLLSDSADAIGSILSNESFYGPEGAFLEMARKEMDDALVWATFHISRTRNEVAHGLAKFALSSPCPHAWIGDDVLLWIRDLARHS